MAIEYDGPYHNRTEQAKRDAIKNSLCRDAGLPIIRINANYVLRKYRGMTLLRWIIEVLQMQASFDEAQARGDVPFDEAFDPAMIISDGSSRKWPYWLSADAHARIHNFLRDTRAETQGWVTLFGEEEEQRLHCLEYIYFDDQALFVRTSLRNQDANVPQFDMIREVTHCEMGERLMAFFQGDHQLVEINRFKQISDIRCAFGRVWVVVLIIRSSATE
jgi:Protein of unknown function (DUF2726)